MNTTELTHQRLLEIDEGGPLRFAGHRVLLLDPASLGVLRKYLVENVGLAATRTMLTRFGFDLGWQMATSMKSDFTWDSDADWQNAGARMLELDGLLRSEEGELRGDEGLSAKSTEAQQHLSLYGSAESPVCWMVCGLLSGYLSRATGEEYFVLEDKCVGMGHEKCHLQARTREAWGVEREEALRVFAAPLNAPKPRPTDLPSVELDESTGLVARSAAMRSTIELAMRVAKVDARVLITGESGSGKERIARLVHDESSRALGPFVAINCGAITETLLESELFGHAKGAFTGANHDRAGLFEAAHNGTLLLDEIGEISPAMQVKLLRVLQEHEVRRVGETRSRSVDVRVLASTNRDLAQSVAEGTFRQDLYYRLKVVEITVPPLRERREDLLPLATHLLDAAAQREKRTLDGFTPEAGEQLLRYAWPGNVRELENIMERAVALARGQRVELEDLPTEVCATQTEPALTVNEVRALEDVVKDYILAALQKNDGNQTHTAQQLKIGSATLYRKLKRYGLITGRTAN